MAGGIGKVFALQISCTYIGDVHNTCTLISDITRNNMRKISAVELSHF